MNTAESTKEVESHLCKCLDPSCTVVRSINNKSFVLLSTPSLIKHMETVFPHVMVRKEFWTYRDCAYANIFWLDYSLVQTNTCNAHYLKCYPTRKKWKLLHQPILHNNIYQALNCSSPIANPQTSLCTFIHSLNEIHCNVIDQK